MTLTVRDARVEEAPVIHALLEEHAGATFGEAELSLDEVRSWFGYRNLRIKVAERGGRLVGYLDVRSEPDEHFDVDIRTLDREVAPALVSASEEYARESAVSPVLRGYVLGDDPVNRPAYELAGWRPIRHSFQMRIDLTDDLPEPGWPGGLAPRNVRPGEERRVFEANMAAFADHWDFRPRPFDEWRGYTVDHHTFDPELWWLVDDGEELAAFSLNSWHFSGDPQFGWIGILGVRPAWRRRGLATALLRHSFLDFRDRGATRVGLGVDGENTTGAVQLYEQVGMRQVRRNDTYEKRL